ncbi:MAG: ABC transporter permease, partial [Chloroflexi bacterium]|nr:ABC transporter permease [Chloroflexota bacterium]
MIRSINRTLSFFSTWLAEVVRQPWLMLSLVVGPFLILLAFGQGVKLGVPEPRTLLVVPKRQADQSRIQPLPEELNRRLDVRGQTSDLDEARRRLRDGEVDLVAVLPPRPLDAIREGRRAPVQIITNEIDPVLKGYSRTYLQDQIGTLNRETVRKAIADAQAPLIDVQAVIAEARRSLQVMRSAPGDQPIWRQASRDLSTAIARLPGIAGRVSTVVAGAAFVVPGLTPESESARQFGASVENLRRSVSALDSRLTSTAGAGGQPAPSSDELSQIESELARLETATNQLKSIPPDVLSAPFELQLEDIAPFAPNYVGFYAPAVLVLLMQHLAVTLGALSMARIRLLGLMELLQTSPVRAREVVTGNYLSYGLLCAIAGGILLALLVFALGVPVFGDVRLVIGTLAL